MKTQSKKVSFDNSRDIQYHFQKEHISWTSSDIGLSGVGIIVRIPWSKIWDLIMKLAALLGIAEIGKDFLEWLFSGNFTQELLNKAEHESKVREELDKTQRKVDSETDQNKKGKAQAHLDKARGHLDAGKDKVKEAKKDIDDGKDDNVTKDDLDEANEEFDKAHEEIKKAEKVLE